MKLGWLDPMWKSAAVLTAIVAIAGFVESQRSSREIARSLEAVTENLASMTSPLVKLDGCRWISDGAISCESPPTGILVSCRNVSAVPVALGEQNVSVFYGEKLLDDVVKVVGSRSGVILGPGEHTESGTQQVQNFRRFLANNRDVMEGPFIRIQYSVEFGMVASDVRYKYETIVQVGFNCDQPDLMRYSPEVENVTKLDR